MLRQKKVIIFDSVTKKSKAPSAQAYIGTVTPICAGTIAISLTSPILWQVHRSTAKKADFHAINLFSETLFKVSTGTSRTFQKELT